MTKLIKHFTKFLLLLVFANTVVIAQNITTPKLPDINAQTPRDTAILIIEEYLLSNQFLEVDSASRRELYLCLDSLELTDYALKLIDLEIDNTPIYDSFELADLNSRKAFLLLESGMYDKAEELYLQNIETIMGKYNQLLTPNYAGLATLYLNQTELEQAFKYVDLFLESARNQNDTLNIAEAYKLKGNIFFNKADYRNSLKFHIESIPYCDSFLLGSVYNEIGRDYFYMKEFDSAFNYINAALEIKEDVGDIYGYCSSLGNLGHLYRYYGDDTLAMQSFRECEKLAIENDFNDMLAWMKRSLSAMFASGGDYKMALIYFQSFYLINEELITKNNDVRFAVEKARSNAANQQYYMCLLRKENEVEKLKSLRFQYIILALALLTILAVLIIVLIRLRNKKRTLELKQKISRAQMNPHFIFNSLNLLQQNILKGDVQASNKFLSKFSSLMRSTLENSYNDLVSLEKEITHLKAYLELEAMRFKDKFEYHLIVDEKLDLQNYKIPSMIIQPFVENAIWHGLLNKESGNRLLNIRIEEKGEDISCIIKDNGIGREKSMELKKQKQKDESRKSLGIEITRQRLNNLSKIYKKNFLFEFDDINKNEEESGTIVTIYFPIII